MKEIVCYNNDMDRLVNIIGNELKMVTKGISYKKF